MPPQEDLTEVKKPTSLLVAQFFLFPLVIIAFGIGIFVLFGYVTFDQKSPEAYLREIQQGGAYSPFDSRRWQAALELSKVIATQKESLIGSGFTADLIAVYAGAKPADMPGDEAPDFRLRQFLAVSLGHLGDPAAVPALIEGLDDADPEAQIWTLWALGTIGDESAAPAVARKMQSGDPAVRKTAAYVLGALGAPATAHSLRVALNDSAADVRWNAAMALARMKDDSGADLLMRLTDREYLARFPEMTEEDKDNVIVNAVKCLGILRLENARDQIVLLSRNDPSLQVRDAAIETLETYALDTY